jgi:hypothetical protein
VGEVVRGLLGFVVLLCVGCVSVVVVVGACVRDCSGLGLCKVGIVGWALDDEGGVVW